MTRLQPGDLVEISAVDGLAYVQVTHLHTNYPEIVRALPGIYGHRPARLDEVAAQPTRFIATIPLSDSLQNGSLDAALLGNFTVPVSCREFPLFRIPITDSAGSQIYWWFWDGDTLSREPPYDIDVESLPVRSIMSANSLKQRLQSAG